MHHVIVKSEVAVRAENERLQAEIKKLRADNNRLRALAGEPALAEVKAHVTALADVQQFTAGDCRVTIGRGNPASAAGNPASGRAPTNAAAAMARSQVSRAPLRFNMQTKEIEPGNVASQLAALAPPAPNQNSAATETEAEETNDLSRRVALLELK